jgi:hypothetical protein
MKKGQRFVCPVKILFPGLERLVFGKDRGDGLCGNGTPHKSGELAAVMDMRYLETDNEPETEAGQADHGITDDIHHIIPPFRTPW